LSGMEPDRLADGISGICSRYGHKGLLAGAKISSRKLANATESMKIPAGERVIAFLDCTVFGSGKNGMAICDSGLYWNNDWTTSTSTNHLSWESFKHVNIRYADKFVLELGPGNNFNTSAAAMKREDILQLLQQIQEFVRQDAMPDRIQAPSVEMTSGTEPDRLVDGICDICSSHFGRDCYVGSDIPGKTLANAVKSMNITEDERILAFIDGTVFGSGKNGMAIGSRGIYWKNASHTPTARNYLSWDMFRDVEIESGGNPARGRQCFHGGRLIVHKR